MKSYPDTPSGWLDQSRDKWAAELAAAGHLMDWLKVGRVTWNTRDSHHYLGTCRNCGGRVEAGEYWSTILAEPRPLKRGNDVQQCPGRS